MLPPSLFAPLDLHDAVEEARRTQGAHGVVDLLVVTLTDRRLRSDAEIDQHLGTLKSACRQTRRYREAIPVLERIGVLSPDRKHESAAEVALALWHLGEHAKAVAMLESAVAQHLRLPASRRSLSFSLVAEVAALQLGRPALAEQCVAIGWSTASAPSRRARRTTRPAVAATPAHNERAASAGRTEQTAPPGRPTRPATPRRRAGLARPVLAAEPALEIDTEQVASGRPLLTLITGSAA